MTFACFTNSFLSRPGAPCVHRLCDNLPGSRQAKPLRFGRPRAHCRFRGFGRVVLFGLSPAHRSRVLGRSWQRRAAGDDAATHAGSTWSPFGCDREDGRRCCRHRGWSSNPLFRASQPLVPELIRSADIKLNERISLPRAATIVSSSQLRGVSPRPSHHYRAIRGRRFAKGRRPRPSPCQPTTLRAEVIAKPSRVARS
jgi:hypothetical protein